MKKAGIILVILVVAFVGFVFTRPGTFRVERSVTVQAPPAVVYAIVNDFRRWDDWSPWAKLDPNMKKELGGTASGVGATYYWAGNDEVGEGRMTITESKPGESVRMKLEFIKPWAATNKVEIAIKNASGGSTVSWSIDGPNNFISKAFSVFMNMDTMIGADFEKGLAQLKTLAEGEAKKVAEASPEAPPPAAPEAAPAQ
jgi:hypothetical protein